MHDTGAARAFERRLRLVRAAVGAYAAGWGAIRLPHHVQLSRVPASRWDPVGVLAPLGAPPSTAVVTATCAVAVVAAAVFAVGRRPALTGPAAALATLAVTTYGSSFGQVFHTENLLALHLLLLGGAAAVAPLLARARRTPPDPELVLRLLTVATATAYVVTGVAKLRAGGLGWLAGDALRDQVAFDNLRKALVGAPWSPVGAWAVRHGWLFTPFAALTVLVELAAPVALLGERWALRWTAVAWAFHAGVLVVMAIGFPYQLAVVAFLPALPLERGVDAARRRLALRRERVRRRALPSRAA